MSWNYRVMKRSQKNPLFGKPHKPVQHADVTHDFTPDPGPEFIVTYGIHECFYDEGCEVPWGWTADPVSPATEEGCGVIHELRDQLTLMLRATEKPILDCDMKPAERTQEKGS